MMTTNPNHPLRSLILDMDGVLWRAAKPIGDLPSIFKTIARRGWLVILATNNATRTPAQYLERLRSLGVTSLEPWQVINSAQAAAHYLKERFPQGGCVYVVGEAGLQEAVVEQGFTLGEENVVAVAAGMDRQLTYDKLRTATLLVRRGALLVGTNPDKTFPTPLGEVPGAGAILAALEAATGVQAVVAGKPSPYMYRVALERLGTPASQTLVVGDRLETDIAGAQPLGCQTALVLSGVTPLERAKTWTPQPDYIAADLAELLVKIN